MYGVKGFKTAGIGLQKTWTNDRAFQSNEEDNLQKRAQRIRRDVPRSFNALVGTAFISTSFF